jgi:hypothetical protein
MVYAGRKEWPHTDTYTHLTGEKFSAFLGAQRSLDQQTPSGAEIWSGWVDQVTLARGVDLEVVEPRPDTGDDQHQSRSCSCAPARVYGDRYAWFCKMDQGSIRWRLRHCILTQTSCHRVPSTATGQQFDSQSRSDACSCGQYAPSIAPRSLLNAGLRKT